VGGGDLTASAGVKNKSKFTHSQCTVHKSVWVHLELSREIIQTTTTVFTFPAFRLPP